MAVLACRGGVLQSCSRTWTGCWRGATPALIRGCSRYQCEHMAAAPRALTCHCRRFSDCNVLIQSLRQGKAAMQQGY